MWLLLAFVLLVGSAALLGWRLRWLWRRFRGLLDELSRAEDTLSALEDRVADLTESPGPSVPPVLARPSELAAEYAEARAEQRRARDERRAANWPAWAPTVSGTPRVQETPRSGTVH